MAIEGPDHIPSRYLLRGSLEQQSKHLVQASGLRSLAETAEQAPCSSFRNQKSGWIQGERLLSTKSTGPVSTPCLQVPTTVSPLGNTSVPLPSLNPVFHSPWQRARVRTTNTVHRACMKIKIRRLWTGIRTTQRVCMCACVWSSKSPRSRNRLARRGGPGRAACYRASTRRTCCRLRR